MLTIKTRRFATPLSSWPRFFMLGLLIWLTASAVQAQTSAFTYQGRLTDNGAPANGFYDLGFDLYNVASSGSPLAALALAKVPVSNGLFVVTLDFGTANNNFDGGDRWLQIGVRTNGSLSGYT